MSDTWSANATLTRRAVWEDLTGASFSVVGLGKSGVAAANALVARGADVLCVDDAPEAKLAAAIGQLDRRVAVHAGDPQGPVGRRGDLFVVSPGVMPHSRRFGEIRGLATAILSEIELFYRLDRAANGGLGHPIVAISGTDGKTTTTLWAAHLLRQAGHEVIVGGNIGDPLCGFLGKLGSDAVVVAEVSAFQLYTCSLFRPRSAVVTNIAADHTDWFAGDFDAYVRTKVAVAAQMGPGDAFAINGDDPELADHRSALGDRRLAWQVFTTQGVPDRGLGFDGDRLWWCPGDRAAIELARAADLGCEGKHPIVGTHNVENALAATALALGLGADLNAIRSGLRTFSLPSHRIEPAGTIGAVRFVDDSKATNPHAAIAGLRAMSPAPGEKLVWIGGGSEKEADFAEVGAVVGELATAAVLIGQTADRMAACLPAGLAVEKAATLQEAVARAWQLAQPAGVVLLSPACASFDMFSGYAQRGEVFQAAVAALKAAVEPGAR
ncbi:MAG: UDP-N-acetylmuramoyl-L-alanine--D-glutamate ligase [Deltaproteobacteria bacterium]|nr:UDP-N-acetylmuramoyl-L-alanine--D-glutamate ligase [Deltaproteobacteria bacterium]